MDLNTSRTDLCQKHLEKVVHVCFASSCQDRYLCPQCIKFHPKSHVVFQDKFENVKSGRLSVLDDIVQIIESYSQDQKKSIDQTKEQIELYFEELKRVIVDEFEQVKQKVLESLMASQAKPQEQGSMSTILLKYKNQLEDQMKSVSIPNLQKESLTELNLKTNDQSSQNFCKEYSTIRKKVSKIKSMLSTEEISPTMIIRSHRRSDSNPQIMSFKKQYSQLLESVSNIQLDIQQKTQQQESQRSLNSMEDIEMTEEDEQYKPNERLLEHQKRTYSGHRKIWRKGLCYNQQEDLLISAGEEGKIRVWDLKQQEPILEFQGHNACISQVIYAKEANSIFTAAQDLRIKRWQFFDKRSPKLHKVYLHDQPLNAIAHLKTTNFLVSGDSAGYMQLWKLEKGTKLASIELDSTITCLSNVDFGTKKTDRIVAGTWEGTLYIIDINKDQKIQIPFKTVSHQGKKLSMIYPVKYTKTLFTSGNDGTLCRWKMKNSELVMEKVVIQEESTLATFAVIGGLVKAIPYILEKNKYLTFISLDGKIILDQTVGHQQAKFGQALIYIEEKNLLITSFADELRFWKIGNRFTEQQLQQQQQQG